jgi:thiol-disulfide isomerase/thioredoxin
VTTQPTQTLSIWTLALLAGACGSAQRGAAEKPGDDPSRTNAGPASAACDTPPPNQPVDLAAIEVIHPHRRVPTFSVTSVDCRPLRSEELVGRRPLVLVFFSSWCGVCDMKMPLVREAARRAGGTVEFVGVALDDDDTWDAVPSFVGRHHLAFPLVRGMRFPAFTLGYNPFGGVPVVVVVGIDGRLVDLQVGYSPADLGRLLVATEIAGRPDPAQLSPAEHEETPVTLPDSGS